MANLFEQNRNYVPGDIELEIGDVEYQFGQNDEEAVAANLMSASRSKPKQVQGGTASRHKKTAICADGTWRSSAGDDCLCADTRSQGR